MGSPGEKVAQQVETAITPLLQSLGYEVALVEFIPRSHILRLYIDSSDHQHGVGLDDCSSVSGRVSDLLDAEAVCGQLSKGYTLEVSSPGLDRPLVKPRDFLRFVGHKAQVRTSVPQGGRRKFRGELLAADEVGIRIATDGEPHSLGYDVIERARLIPEL